MHSVVLIIVPIDTPDIRGMIDGILEPYRQDHGADGKCAWPFWDYWSFYDDGNERTTNQVHESSIPIADISESNLYAAIFTPDAEMHDCKCPMPTQEYDSDSVAADFDRHCRPILAEYQHDLGVTVRLHT